MAMPLITLLTDFGLVDPSVGACRGVINAIAPGIHLADVSHNIPPYDIERGARMLEYALPYYPAGTIHVAVVDPGVGTTRRGVAIRVQRGDILIGPDNGLLMWAADKLGGAVQVHELKSEKYRHRPVSMTFHARDVFCPAAAHLARGVDIADLGPAIEPGALVRLHRQSPTIRTGEVIAPVATIATFGNCHFDVLRSDWEKAELAGRPEIAVDVDGQHWKLPFRGTFGEVGPGTPLLLEDSFGRLCLAINQGNASAEFGLKIGTQVRFSLAR